MDFKHIPSKVKNRYKLYKYINPFVEERLREGFDISPKNTIAIFAHPRGGSTWLAEILLKIRNSLLIDEPLWRGSMVTTNSFPDDYDKKVPEAVRLGFYYNQPIPRNAESAEAKRMLESILKGQVPSLGLYEENDLRKLKNGQVHIVKFCYGLLLMDWFVNNFNVNSILLVRHPCAVVASQMARPAWKNIQIEKHWEIPDCRFRESYLDYKGIFEKADTLEKYLAAFWAFSLKDLLGKENNKSWATISYEGLIVNYEQELKRLFSRLPFAPPAQAFDQLNIPSKSAYDAHQGLIGTPGQLTKWKDRLNKRQVDQILGTVREFGVEGYTANPEPDYSKIYNQNQQR